MTEHAHAPGVILCQDCIGLWVLQTASGSAHVVDLDRMTMRRERAVAPPQIASDGEPFVASCRPRDGAWLRLVAFEPIRLGQPAQVWLAGVTDDQAVIATPRVTTPVVLLPAQPDG